MQKTINNWLVQNGYSKEECIVRKKIQDYAKKNEEMLIEKIYLSIKEHGDNSGNVLKVYEGLTEYTDDAKSQILPCEKKDYIRFKEEFENEYSSN